MLLEEPVAEHPCTPAPSSAELSGLTPDEEVSEFIVRNVLERDADFFDG